MWGSVYVQGFGKVGSIPIRLPRSGEAGDRFDSC